MKATSLLRFKLDELRGRYEAFLVRSDRDRGACHQVLEQVRRGELRRVHEGSAAALSGFSEQGSDTRLFAVRDTASGQIVGCVRGALAGSVFDQPPARHEYALDQLPPALIQRTAVAARMVVLPEHRKRPASLALVRELYRYGLCELGMALFVISCEPALLGLYQRLGYRPTRRVWAKPTGGFRLPMVMVGHDEAHLATVRSPLLRVARRAGLPADPGAAAWATAHLPGVDAGVRAWTRRDAHPAIAQLIRDLSRSGASALLSGAVVVQARAGDCVYRRGDGVPGLVLVLSGSVHTDDGTGPSQRGPHSVIGVRSTASGVPRLGTAVVAEGGATLLMLRRRATGQVRSDQDRRVLWRNAHALAATAPAGSRSRTCPAGAAQLRGAAR